MGKLLLLIAMCVGQINTGKDVIPDFAAKPTHSTVADGDWFDPAIWDNGVPGPDSIVNINTNVNITGEANVNTIGVRGKLTCVDSKINYVNILIYEKGGFYQYGRNLLVFKDVAPTDSLQFGTGLICLGHWEANESASGPSPRYEYLGDIKAGTNALVIPNAKVGDRVAFADPRPQVVYNEADYYGSGQCEDRVITEVNNGVCYFVPLNFSHSKFTPVAYLSTGILITSENPKGNRGHVMLTGNASCSLQGVTFKDLGRTKAAPLGVSNQIGRYSLHVHHAHNGENIKINRCSIDGNLRWGFALHGSNNCSITENVIYNSQGAGFAIEDGSETNNIISGNYILKVTGTPNMSANQRGEEASHRQGNGFWVQGLNNTFTNNIVVNCRAGGFNFFKAHGNDTSVRNPPSGVFTAPPMGLFKDNYVACSAFGVETWTMQGNVVKIDNLNCYNCMRGIRIPFVTDTIEVNGLSYTCDNISLDTRWAAMAMDVDGGYVKTLVAKNVYVKKSDYGYFMREMVPQSVILQDSLFQDCKKGVFVQSIMHYAENPHKTKEFIIINTTYPNTVDPVSIFTGAVQARYAPLKGSWRLLALNHNGNDYELFTPEQDQKFTIPPYIANPIPFYGTGKINADSWMQNSIAIGMQVAPLDAVNGNSLGFRNLLVTPYKVNPQIPPLNVMVISYTNPLWVAVLGDRTKVDTLELTDSGGITKSFPMPSDPRVGVTDINTNFNHKSGDTYKAVLLKDKVVVLTKTIGVP